MFKLLDNTFEALCSTYSVINRKDRFPKFVETLDPEIEISKMRLNFIFDNISTGVDIDRIFQILGANSVTDTYSLSQQIGNLFYLSKSEILSQKDFNHHFEESIKYRLDFVAQNYEYRRNNLWFTNHLLNNYRSLVIFSQYSDEKTLHAANRISEIITNNLETLFFPDTLVSVEGSSNYEILILKHCYEISRFSRANTHLDEVIAKRLDAGRQYLRNTYFLNGKITMPNFGDLSPDWSAFFMNEFLAYFVEGCDNSYTRLVT